MTLLKAITSAQHPKWLEIWLLEAGQRPSDLGAFRAWRALHPAKALAVWFDRPTRDITGAIPPCPAPQRILHTTSDWGRFPTILCVY